MRNWETSISDVIKLSTKLRKRVGKPEIEKELRAMFDRINPDADEYQRNSAREFLSSTFSIKRVSPLELFLEAARTIRLSYRSTLARSLDRHYQYYRWDLFEKPNAGFLASKLKDLRPRNTLQDTYCLDVLCHAMIAHQLGGTEETFLAFPIARKGLLLGWVLVSASDLGSCPSPSWPSIPDAEGVLQNYTRDFRQTLEEISVTKCFGQKRIVVLLRASVGYHGGLYLSDPIEAVPEKGLDGFLGATQFLNRLICEIDTDSGRPAAAEQTVIPFRASAEHEITFIEQTRNLALNITRTQKGALVRRVIGEEGADIGLVEAVWAAAGQAIGWDGAVNLVAKDLGHWRIKSKRKGDALSWMERSLRPQNGGAISVLDEVLNQAAVSNWPSPCLVNGGLFHGLGTLLLIPSSWYDQYADPSFIVFYVAESHDPVVPMVEPVCQQLENAKHNRNPRLNEFPILFEDPSEIPLTGSHWVTEHLVCANITGPLGKAISELEGGIREWVRLKEKDLVIVRGDSRSGKGFVLKQILKKCGYGVHKGDAKQLRDTDPKGFCRASYGDLESGKQVALIFDEFPTGSEGRTFNDAFDEKVLHGFDLSECIFCVVSSEDVCADVENRGQVYVEIPPLPYHRDDIPFIVAKTLHTQGWNSISKAAMAKLLDYEWPNIKELRSTLERTTRSSEDGCYRFEDLPQPFQSPFWPHLDVEEIEFISGV